MGISGTSSSPEVAGDKLGLYKRASLLAQVTIFYNLIEGIVSVFLGVSDETKTISLFYLANSQPGV